ncbi:2,3-bisphosphoglycerate-independent phosphoglycerate mutase [Helicobacter sp. 11S02629-2]|uniref:2,3-bisphosphoglycerate-independent phosphoglycerate mutase n=1 Tax=Helicobacter sp. 11S02629-2 TaxID=1476195 RepID=UPI000BA6AC8B|nr:2,3-bisphosphoglycerate-independent phosphoglycerate mutase [Helicobacter sp. 11S02629-2]PAF45878.1 phosphoglycerate mutase (2,3-diphosphoglycerate-independent) [Helicobacter sp. 11S02629-2]
MGQKVVLVITDGIGYSDKEAYNAFVHAKKPNYDYLFKHVPNSLVSTHGLSVGLPSGQMGNSEVGHMCIGSGRVLYQDLVRITKALDSGELSQSEVLKDFLEPLDSLHICGLLSDGGVHSHISHLKGLLNIIKDKKIYLHLITDGRDTKPLKALEFIKEMESFLDDRVKIATIIGRFYAMDRDNRWDRVELAYKSIVEGANKTFLTPSEYVKASFENEILDEFIEPASFFDYEGFNKNDGFLFFNYRSDRARELVGAIGLKEFSHFKRDRGSFKTLCMCEYDENFNFPILFPKQKVKDTLAEIVSKHGLKQAHIAETEKYAHVTFFLNGGVESAFLGEERFLVASPNVKTYDLKPEMSAYEVKDKVIDSMQKGFDFIVVNFANGDMVGHTGNYEAAISAVEVVDKCIGEIFKESEKLDYAFVMTSDHGNCEAMKDENLKPLTNHTVGDVFLFINAKGVSKVENGALDNIAPSVLKIMGLPIDPKMSKPLI